MPSKAFKCKFEERDNKYKYLKTLIEVVQKDVFNSSNYNKIKGYIATEETKALKTIENDVLR